MPAFIFIFLLWVAAIVGWVMNFIAVIHLFTSHAAVDGQFILRIVGIPVAFVGAVLGYI